MKPIFFIKDLVALAKTHKKKVLIVIGGANKGSAGFLEIAKDPQKMTAFLDNLYQYATKNGVEGIDIDWEYWTYQSELNKGGNDPIESQQLVNMLSLLRAKLPSHYLLTASVAPGSWVGDQYLIDIQNHVDFINLMAFDFTGAWPSSDIKHHADFSTFKKAIDHTLSKGFKKEKILVGLPAYGIEFIDGNNKKITNISYIDIVKKLNGDLNKLEKGKVDNIYFENIKNIQKKSTYINTQGLAGIFLFEITSDHPEPLYSLLHASNQIIAPKN